MAYFNYNTLVPVHFLKAIEKGQMILSLKNVSGDDRLSDLTPLEAARYFVDIPTGQIIDLKQLSAVYSLTREAVQAPYLYLFVKGGAYVRLWEGKKVQSFLQNYGEVYQVFKVPTGLLSQNAPPALSVEPLLPGKQVSVLIFTGKQ